MQIAIRLASLFNTKAKLFVTGRKDIWPKLESAMLSDSRKKAWFHCASLGEFEQGRPVIERYRVEFPSHSIVLTFFSPSGYEVRKNDALADHIFYLPIDSRSNAERFVDLISPTIVYFVKYEFWHHYILYLKTKGIPIISFSSIFRSSQLFFRAYGGFYRNILSRFEHFFVQNKTSMDLLEKIHIHNTIIAGDTRFDRVYETSSNSKPVVTVEQFKGKSNLMVIGSSWSEDLEMLIPYINTNASADFKFVIAPHEIHKKELESLQEKLSINSALYSNYSHEKNESYEVLIIDNIGLLSSIYQYADFTYVGGAFGKGLHNILESATFGTPVFFGNRSYHKFQEAIDLIALKCAFPIRDNKELASIIDSFLSNPSKLEENKKRCINYITNNLGATEKIINYTKSILSERESF